MKKYKNIKKNQIKTRKNRQKNTLTRYNKCVILQNETSIN